ncbi:hypothetical protein WA026_021010 [Henosepilachna vigintioctopunctata]|uniref:Ankyrin repeat domain-containing protein 54 n=1 Tax=Henosepilachna vigintioctopunctata TaxID=420089 RepID=A0AAW1VAC7_9CUCU
MSHSDSEVRTEDTDRKGKLTALFKAKIRHGIVKHRSNQTSTANIKHRLKPILLEFRLISCVNTNNEDEVRRLLALGVSANTIDIQLRSALHIAVTRGYKEIVRLLLHYGADPNKRDMIQNTPLHLAACANNFSIISMLLDAGADVDSVDMNGRHPLQLAKSKLQILHKCWMQGDIEMIKFRSEIQDVINLMISVKHARERNLKVKSEDTSDVMKLTINNLENMKLTMNSDKVDNMEHQMSQLLNGLQNFQIT